MDSVQQIYVTNQTPSSQTFRASQILSELQDFFSVIHVLLESKIQLRVVNVLSTDSDDGFNSWLEQIFLQNKFYIKQAVIF